MTWQTILMLAYTAGLSVVMTSIFWNCKIIAYRCRQAPSLKTKEFFDKISKELEAFALENQT